MVKIGEIAGDKVHGAREVSLRGVLYLGEHVRSLDSDMPIEAARQKVIDAIENLIEAQPSMASIFNISNVLLLKIEPAKTTEDLMALGLKYLEDERFHEAKELDDMARYVSTLYKEGMKVMVHSHSSTVNKLLITASDFDFKFSVLVCEGRPVLEGRLTAEELKENEIDVSLICDAAATSAMKDVDIVLLGTDAITKEGAVNKTGSLSLALAAKYFDKPLYILTTSEKLYPAKAGTVPIEEQDPLEVWHDAPEGVCVENYYYEYIPLDLITGIITEEGLLSNEEVMKRLEELPVSSLIQPPR